MYTTFDTVVLVGLESNSTRTTDSNLKKNNKYQLLHTVVPSDDGPRYAPNV